MVRHCISEGSVNRNESKKMYIMDNCLGCDSVMPQRISTNSDAYWSSWATKYLAMSMLAKSMGKTINTNFQLFFKYLHSPVYFTSRSVFTSHLSLHAPTSTSPRVPENVCSTLTSYICFGEEIRRWRRYGERKTRVEHNVLHKHGEELEDTVTERKVEG